MFTPFYLASTRPSRSPETLRPTGLVEAPLVALFDSQAGAEAALASIGGRLLSNRSQGVITMEPAAGLRESLYAAGAMLVVGQPGCAASGPPDQGQDCTTSSGKTESFPLSRQDCTRAQDQQRRPDQPSAPRGRQIV
jgi:hypothetical protein